MTNSLRGAKKEWEANTTPCPKNHPVGKKIHIHEFRQFDKAIAFLNWEGDCVEITKLETLEPGQGGPSRLICYLKALADKYEVSLWGHARCYEPDLPTPKGHLLAKEELEAFYRKHGFQLRKIDSDTSEIRYFHNRNLS